jgi:hypothetical protein
MVLEFFDLCRGGGAFHEKVLMNSRVPLQRKYHSALDYCKGKVSVGVQCGQLRITRRYLVLPGVL